MAEEVRSIANLAFWARNMVAIRRGGMTWPGFSYTDPEWARMDALAGAVERWRFKLYTWVNAAIFIAFAAAGIGAIFLPLASILFPVPAETKPLPFVLLLAATALLILGVGLPVSMRITARLVASDATRTLKPAPGDAALEAKIGWQIRRMIIIMCGVLVPGTLIFIAFNIQAGPVITVIKWVSIGLVALSTAFGAARLRS
jgi:hypothetical protein